MKNSGKNYQTISVGIMLAIVLSTADALALENYSPKPQSIVQQPSPDLTNTASYSRFLSAQNAPNRATTEPQKAAQVIRHYYDAINRKDYRSAYADWAGNGAASHQTFEQFQQGFANTASVKVEIRQPGQVNGAAGSLYVEIPVTITAKTVNNVTQRFAGSYTLKRVNDVTGSTLEQRRWHLFSARITHSH